MLRALVSVRSALWRSATRLSSTARLEEAVEASASSAHPEAKTLDESEVPSLEDAVNDDGEAVKQRIAYSRDALAKLKLDQYPFYVEREWWKRGKRMTFWATWRQLRDVKRREAIVETGAERMELRALKWNTVLPQAIRDEAAETLTNWPRERHPKLVLNMCMFTGRQRGKIKPYRVNRHIWRRLADHGQLSGVTRAMW